MMITCVHFFLMSKLKRKVNYIKEIKNWGSNLKKNNKLNFLIKWWNWKQLKVYKR
jgi:hypothetical protein